MNRPLSPHLQIYKVQLSSTLSISHRFTGVALTLGIFALAAWVWAVTQDLQTLHVVQQHVRAWYGQLFLVGWSFSLFYHLFNGLRHLVWDMGYGLGRQSAYRSGLFVIASAVIMTGLVWACAWAEA